MLRAISVVGISSVLACSSALAQTADPGNGFSPQPVQQAPGQLPGVDVSRTLNPQTITTANQTANVALPSSTAPFNPANTSTGPVPYNIGAITVSPSITVGRFYDDNVFATATNRLADFTTFVRPGVTFKLNDTGNATIVGGAYIEQRWADRFSSEDQTNGAIALNSTYAVDSSTQLIGHFQYLHSHEDRGSVESQFQQFARPIGFDQVDMAGAINKRFNGWWTSVGAAVTDVRYENPTLNGAVISQSYRDGDIVRVPARLGFVVAPQTSVFVEGSGNSRDFDIHSFDSNGYRVVGGMLFEPGPGARVKGEVFAGYMNQLYRGAGFQDISTWTYGAAIAFLLTPQLTATFEGRRDPREASLSGGQFVGALGDGVSVIQTVAAGRLDYLVVSNVVLSAGANYVNDAYLGAGRDHAWGPTAALRWYFNPWVTVNLDYRNIDYNQNLVTPTPSMTGYRRNVYIASITGRF